MKNKGIYDIIGSIIKRGVEIMKLIPEQIKIIEQEIEKEKQIRKELQDQDFRSAHTSGDGESNDPNTEEKEALARSNYKIRKYHTVLANAERVQTIEVDKIGLGTKFLLKFEDEEEAEYYTLVDDKIGYNGDLEYISTNSILGKTIQGKKAGEDFSYIVNLDKKENLVKGTVAAIITDKTQYINYIRSKPYSSIRTKKYHPSGTFYLTKSQLLLLEEEINSLLTKINGIEANKEKIQPGSKVTVAFKGRKEQEYQVVDKKESEIDDTQEISWESSFAGKLALSQIGTRFKYRERSKEDGKIKVLSAKVSKVDNSDIYDLKQDQQKLFQLKGRLAHIEKILKESHKAQPVADGEVGIGSHLSIMLFGKENTKIKRVEMIEQAVSYELETDYVEAISPLGVALMGLKNGEEFIYQDDRNYLTGIVYDIDNSKDKGKLTDPLTYQKNKNQNRK